MTILIAHIICLHEVQVSLWPGFQGSSPFWQSGSPAGVGRIVILPCDRLPFGWEAVSRDQTAYDGSMVQDSLLALLQGKMSGGISIIGGLDVEHRVGDSSSVSFRSSD
jgi:hypothetical protein